MQVNVSVRGEGGGEDLPKIIGKKLATTLDCSERLAKVKGIYESSYTAHIAGKSLGTLPYRYFQQLQATTLSISHTFASQGERMKRGKEFPMVAVV